MPFDLKTCKWVVWGYTSKNPHTHGWIHAGLFRALEAMGRKPLWLDQSFDVSVIDFENTFFIGQNDSVEGMPLREDCFYAIHNAYGSPCMPLFNNLKMISFGVHLSTNERAKYHLAPEVPFYFAKPHNYMGIRWATDLLPNEIAANKPSFAFNLESREVNYVGTTHPDYWEQLAPFAKACSENCIDFRTYGGYSDRRVSIEENIALVKRSYLAPAIQPRFQVENGYVPCRIFKNISYGQFGLTNSHYVNALFGGKLIYNANPRELFYEARERLSAMPLERLHGLMDEVAESHTYLNRIAAIEKAAHVTLEM